MCYECLDQLAKVLFVHQKLFFQACFHNYFVSVSRWRVKYSSFIKHFFEFFFFPFLSLAGVGGWGKPKNHSLKKATTCSLLSFTGPRSVVCDMTSVPHSFPLRNRPSVRNCEEKIYIIAGNTHFSPSFTSVFWNQVLACTLKLEL